MSRAPVRWLCLLAALCCGILGAVVDAGPAYACECVSRSTTRALREADAVFRGTVTKRSEIRQDGGSRLDLRFEVRDVFKGTVYADQVVATPASGGSCGLDAQVGTSWLVFANDGIEGTGDRAVQRLVSTACAGSRAGDRTPAVLGQPRPPLEGASDRVERSVQADRRLTRGVLSVGLGFLGLGVVLTVGLVVVWRPGRPSGSAGPEG